MKLIARYNRINIPIIVSFVVFSSIAYYVILHFVFVHQLDNDLKIEQQEIFDHVKLKGFLPAASTY